MTMHHNVFNRIRRLAALLLAAVLVATTAPSPSRAAQDIRLYMPVLYGLGNQGETPADVAIARVNRYRAQAGVPLVQLDAALLDAAQRHATYAILNDGDASAWVDGPHGEIRGKPGFSGATMSDRARATHFPYAVSAEVIDYRDDPAGSVDDLMATVVHRMGLLFPWHQYGGYGHGRSPRAAVDVLDFGRGPTETLDLPHVVVFPAAGQAGVPIIGWDEAPSVLPPNAPYPFGYPVTAQLAGGSALSVSQAELRDGTGAPVAVHPNPDGCAAVCYALIPVNPLTPSTRYTAHIAGTVDGTPFETTWTFTTASCANQRDCFPASAAAGDRFSPGERWLARSPSERPS